MKIKTWIKPTKSSKTEKYKTKTRHSMAMFNSRVDKTEKQFNKLQDWKKPEWIMKEWKNKTKTDEENTWIRRSNILLIRAFTGEERTGQKQYMKRK